MLFSLRGRIGIGLGVFMGIIAAIYLGFYIPQIRFVERAKREIIEERLRLKQATSKIEDYEKLRQECEDLRKRSAYYEGLYLSAESEISSLLQELGLRAQIYGIRYTKIILEEPMVGDYYDCIPMRVHLYSTYHALGRLLSDIGKRQKITSFSAKNIQIRSPEPEESPGGYNTVEVDLVIYIYTQKKGILSLPAARDEREGGFSPLSEEGKKVRYSEAKVNRKRRK